MVLKELEKRIKGTRYWNKYGKERLYFNTKTYKDKYCNVDIWIEVINDNLQFQARVFHERKDDREFYAIARRIEHEMTQNYHEILLDSELKRKETHIHERLKDNCIPISNGSMPHQKEALDFLCGMKVGALFADVGRGKTKIAIDLAQSRFLSGRIKKVLVFAPFSTIENFKTEVKKFCTQDSIIWEYIGIESISNSFVAYEKADYFVDPETMLIVDESHLVKTPTAIRSKLIYEISQKCIYKLIMTGTPIAENIHDLYMQYAILSNLIMDCNSWNEYKNRYVLYGGITGNDIVGYKNLDYLTGLIEPYTYQINKKDCLCLPERMNYTYTCDLNENQLEIYDKTKQKLLDVIDSGDYTNETIFTFLTKLQQITCGYYYDKNDKFVYIGTNKFELLKQIGIPEQCLFFCKYLFEVDLIVEYLGLDKCSVFTGKNRKQRNIEKELFINGFKKYFVATSASGGTGLNGLQVCNTIFQFSRTFKYIEEKQTIGRIERPGQTQTMFVYDLITNSGIDRKIQKNINRKSGLDTEIKKLLYDKQKLRKYLSDL